MTKIPKLRTSRLSQQAEEDPGADRVAPPSASGFPLEGRKMRKRGQRVQAGVRKLLKSRSKGPLRPVHKRCRVCGQPVTSRQPAAKYCDNPVCRRRAYYTPINRKVPSGTVASVSELRVGADLLQKGYEVFRSLSPHSTCGLMIFKQGKSFRVEVRTGRENPQGEFIFSRKRLDQVDVVAVALSQRIAYLLAAQVRTGKAWWPATIPPTSKVPI